jgi:hypothetical protein
MKLIDLSTAREFTLTLSGKPANRLPKRTGTISVSVDGAAFLAPVTTNRGWAASPEVVIEYIWVLVSGKGYYATLPYGEAASSFVGATFRLAEGRAADPIPARIGDPTREANRIAAFRVTYAARSV